jgi:hypothetical protein
MQCFQLSYPLSCEYATICSSPNLCSLELLLSTYSKTLSRDLEVVPTTKRMRKGRQLPPTKELKVHTFLQLQQTLVALSSSKLIFFLGLLTLQNVSIYPRRKHNRRCSIATYITISWLSVLRRCNPATPSPVSTPSAFQRTWIQIRSLVLLHKPVHHTITIQLAQRKHISPLHHQHHTLKPKIWNTPPGFGRGQRPASTIEQGSLRGQHLHIHIPPMGCCPPHIRPSIPKAPSQQPHIRISAQLHQYWNHRLPHGGSFYLLQRLLSKDGRRRLAQSPRYHAHRSYLRCDRRCHWHRERLMGTTAKSMWSKHPL